MQWVLFYGEKMFTYGSICSGIEAASVAWKDLGESLWFSEIEPFPCAVLAHHYPDIPNLGDMTALPEKILNREIPAPDVLVGGTPCQAFSIAGKRESLNDDRGSLTLALIHILEAIDYVRFNDGKAPCVLVWENVPGVLSTKDNAFGHFLAGLAQETEPLQPTGKRWTNAGYVHGKRTVVWRTLDAQYFGVAQRRKRVFVVASAGARSVAQILIEQKGVSGNIEPGRKTEQGLTAYVAGSSGTYCKSDVGGTVRANGGQENVLFEIKGEEAARVHTDNISPTLKARMGTGGNNVPCIALAGNTIGRKPGNGGNGNGFDESGVSYTLTSTDIHAVANNTIVRKLTPIECERLQGFPDDYTKTPYRNKSIEDSPDSPRYKALGNSMAVPVMRWIGERLGDYLKQA